MDIDELDFNIKLKSAYQTDPFNNEKRLYQLLELFNMPFTRRDKHANFLITRYLTLAYSNVDDTLTANKLIADRMNQIGWDVSNYRFTKDYIFPTLDEVELLKSLPIKSAKEILIIGCYEGMGVSYFLDKLIEEPYSVDLIDIEEQPNLKYNILNRPYVNLHIKDSTTFVFYKLYDFIHINGTKEEREFKIDLRNSLNHIRAGGTILISYMGIKGQQLRKVAFEILAEKEGEFEVLNELKEESKYLVVKKVVK